MATSAARGLPELTDVVGHPGLGHPRSDSDQVGQDGGIRQRIQQVQRRVDLVLVEEVDDAVQLLSGRHNRK